MTKWGLLQRLRIREHDPFTFGHHANCFCGLNRFTQTARETVGPSAPSWTKERSDEYTTIRLEQNRRA